MALATDLQLPFIRQALTKHPYPWRTDSSASGEPQIIDVRGGVVVVCDDARQARAIVMHVTLRYRELSMAGSTSGDGPPSLYDDAEDQAAVDGLAM